jgi:hypothetical protein
MGTAKFDPGSGHSTRLVPGTGGDVLLLSMRQIDKLVAYCTPYEFEDVIAEITGADMVAVDDREALERARRVYKWTRTATRSPRIATRIAPQPSTVRLTRDYDLFLPVFSGTYQLYALAAVPEWRKRCRVAACFITEAWADLLPDYLMELLSEFDHVFLAMQGAVADLGKMIGRPVTYLPYSVDALRFAPLPHLPARSIDMCNIGRRSNVTHEALLRLADAHKIFYYYDTVAAGADLLQRTFRVDVASEHRRLFGSLLQRSRYFIANRSRVNEPQFLAGRDETSARFYEGAAAGTIMLGEAPRNEEFKRQFDWPDAVIHLPFDSPDIGRVIEELDSDPERLRQIRRNNVHHAALRHDWLHRYEVICEKLGVPRTPGMDRRRQALETIAEQALDAPL